MRYKTEKVTIWSGISGGHGGYNDVGNLLNDPADDIFIKFDRYGADLEVDNKFLFLATEFVGGKEIVNDTISYPFGYYVILAAKTSISVSDSSKASVIEAVLTVVIVDTSTPAWTRLSSPL